MLIANKSKRMIIETEMRELYACFADKLKTRRNWLI